MKSYLLYPEKEWVNNTSYFDDKGIIQDLGLRILFMMAARDVIWENDEVKSIGMPDHFIEQNFRKIMMVPLTCEDEIVYRQEILKDALASEGFFREVYELTEKHLREWAELGRRSKEKIGSWDSLSNLIMDIRILRLFVNSLKRIKELFKEYEETISSRGLLALKQRLYQVFSDETEADLTRILQDVSFFVDSYEEDDKEHEMVNRPHIVLECSLDGGMKFQEFKLDELTTKHIKYRDPNSMLGKVQGYMNARTPDSVAIQWGTLLREHTLRIEFEAVHYVMSHTMTFVGRFNTFFDQLHLQSSFYRGAINLSHHMKRFRIAYCFPKVTARDMLRFDDLKEVVMSMEQRIEAVGNTCSMEDIRLLIVTGANQGGKSTFLRSIGIAQVMMQCGLMVTANEYESGIFPAFFTHFTRREDSAMNSGRLDEELGRMNQIVENLGEHSMVLLNESFATTTEKEGSVIAYDIIKALTEAGVKILTVTHLLSFAQRMYDEDRNGSGVEFFSAERLENGKRTFKMIQHAPELTSFGLDLYEEIMQRETYK